MVEQNRKIIENLGLEIYKQSGYELICRCPFHDDKHPSLSINLKTGKYQCFSGCIAGHSIQNLVQKITGEDSPIPDGLDWLTMFKEKLSHTEVQKRLPYIPILPLAIKNEGEKYLATRKFTQDTIKKWNLMYWKSINAIVIPTEDVGYTIRYIDADNNKEKYKYVCGTKITNCLFGFNNLDFRNSNYIILVEGAFDTIWMHQIGFTNTLGILHSNISKTQHNLLKQMTNCVYLMLDGDEEGQKAAAKLSKILRQDFIVKICQLPKNKDPNDCNKEDIEKAIKETR